MPLPEELIRGLPSGVVNELAILEDRAIRAEGQLARSRSRATSLEHEVATLREEVGGMVVLAKGLQKAIGHWNTEIEEHLRHLLVLQAS